MSTDKHHIVSHLDEFTAMKAAYQGFIDLTVCEVTNLDELGNKATVIDAFFQYAQAEQQREAKALIDEEKLNAEAAKRYLTNSLKREFASDSGTELNAVLPKMSRLNPQYLTKKQMVFQKIAAFVEKFKGVGGQV
jgi:type I restriction enzyme R subunit